MLPKIHINDIETPALVVDYLKLKSNIEKMASFMKSVNCSLRPHFKTHKCPVIANLQIDAGAIGITCAKTGEAEILAASGIKDILVANQVVEPSKIRRIAAIAKYCNIIVAVDDLKNVGDLSAAAQELSADIGVVIEADIGMGRCGVRNVNEALELAERIIKSPGLSFKGLMGYEGHCVFIKDFEERRKKTLEANEKLICYKEFLESKGLIIEIVTGGGTGTFNITSRFPGYTEIQAGSYVFMDSKYNSIEGVEFENAAFIISTVVSRPERELAVIDTGMKCMTGEFGIPQVIGTKGATLKALAEEHGMVQIDEENSNLNIGDRVKILPSHICTTVNLHDRYYVKYNDYIMDTWSISARGKFS
ncbi:MAG: DSD1 family PLP-dependent enzyme [Ruminiclostridium sp.]|nr:DSD1 family PLP-dependent enzyme [Ruminiclostridium sp.]